MIYKDLTNSIYVSDTFIEMKCPLCNLEKKTRWYFENDKYVICNCLTCKVPMYVWKDHDIFPTTEERIQMYSDAQKRFPGKKLRLLRRKIPQHFHFHVE